MKFQVCTSNAFRVMDDTNFSGRTLPRIDPCWVFLLFKSSQQDPKSSQQADGMNGILCNLLFPVPNKGTLVRADRRTDGIEQTYSPRTITW